MGEILLYVILSMTSLFMMGFVVHMMVNGLVSPETEILLIAIVCLTVAAVIAYMAWDVIQVRRKK
jgi:hypothetical protein